MSWQPRGGRHMHAPFVVLIHLVHISAAGWADSKSGWTGTIEGGLGQSLGMGLAFSTAGLAALTLAGFSVFPTAIFDHHPSSYA